MIGGLRCPHELVFRLDESDVYLEQTTELARQTAVHLNSVIGLR